MCTIIIIIIIKHTSHNNACAYVRVLKSDERVPLCGRRRHPGPARRYNVCSSFRSADLVGQTLARGVPTAALRTGNRVPEADNATASRPVGRREKKKRPPSHRVYYTLFYRIIIRYENNAIIATIITRNNARSGVVSTEWNFAISRPRAGRFSVRPCYSRPTRLPSARGVVDGAKSSGRRGEKKKKTNN